MIKIQYRPAVRYAVLAMAGCCMGTMLSSCTSWPDDRHRPEIPELVKLPFVDQVWTITEKKEQTKRANRDWPRPLTLNDYKDVLRLLLPSVMDGVERKTDQSWDFGMTTLVGGTAATLGALSGNVGLTNTGLAVGAGGQIGKTYYSTQQVLDQHMNAHTKLSCISTEVANLSEFQRDWAMASGASGSKQADSALIDIAHSIDSVLNGYRRGLFGMAPQVSSREDLLRFATEYQAQATAAKAAASAAGGSANELNPSPPALAASAPLGAASAPATGASAPQTPASSATTPTSAEIVTTTQVPAESRVLPEALPHSTNTGLPTEHRARLLEAGKRYAAKFIDLKVRLEACTKGPISQ